MVIFYSLFVVAASFHAINGLYTFFISWGFIISIKKQNVTLRICLFMLALVILLGLISAWGSYLY
jgi:succinate dehydrogenase / fumarate reductase cytochrome b subunit